MAAQDKIKVVHSNAKWLHTATRALVVAIAGGAGVLSFDGLTSLATASGIRPELAWVWALVVDGFILVATFATYVLKDRVDGDRLKKYYAWLVLALFVSISIFGNAWHSVIVEGEMVLPDWVKICVSAIPPIAFFLAGHLLIIMMTPTSEEKKEHKREEAREERKQRMKDKELASEEKILDTQLKRRETEATTVAKLGAPKEMPKSAEATVKAPVRRAAAKPKEVKESSAKTVVTVETPTQEAEPKVDEAVESPLEVLSDAPEAPLEAVEEVPVAQPAEDSQTSVEPVISRMKAVERLQTMHSAGEPLPSGREVGEWIGRKERSGQNILKEFRDSLVS